AEREFNDLVDAALGAVAARGEGAGVRVAQYQRAVLANGLGRHDEARLAARDAADFPHQPGTANWALSELVEASAKCGQPDTDAFARLEAITRAAGTEWALGIQARARALLNEGDAAEHGYREAIERLERTRMRGELARTRLLYGEWLRVQDDRA